MPSLMQKIAAKAEERGVPLRAHLDLTWRCNERCIHCYLDHKSDGEMTTGEVSRALEQMAEAGTLFLILSGGEIMLRPDIFEIVGRARSLQFDVKLKTNGILIGEREAERFASLGVRRADISIYSHRPEIHDAITLVPGSLERSVAACRHLKRAGIAMRIYACVMRPNSEDYGGVQALASGLGIEPFFLTKVTPSFHGDRAPASLNVADEVLVRVLRDLNDRIEQETPDEYPCVAGHMSCYISPSGEVMPCVAYPIICGSLRGAPFAEIWRNSPALATIRATRNRDLPVCGACPNLPVCGRCPGLAYMDGDALGPSVLDCRTAFARTGVLSPAMQASGAIQPPAGPTPPSPAVPASVRPR